MEILSVEVLEFVVDFSGLSFLLDPRFIIQHGCSSTSSKFRWAPLSVIVYLSKYGRVAQILVLPVFFSPYRVDAMEDSCKRKSCLVTSSFISI